MNCMKHVAVVLMVSIATQAHAISLPSLPELNKDLATLTLGAAAFATCAVNIYRELYNAFESDAAKQTKIQAALNLLVAGNSDQVSSILQAVAGSVPSAAPTAPTTSSAS